VGEERRWDLRELGLLPVPGANGERKGDFRMNVERKRRGLEGARGWFGSVQPA
jgi:hypothetical protein